jgi:hypothetical protein
MSFRDGSTIRLDTIEINEVYKTKENTTERKEHTKSIKMCKYNNILTTS